MKVSVEAYGCTMSTGEGVRFQRELAALGHELVDDSEDADLVIINTCTVIQATENRMFRRIGSLAGMKKDLVVGGCLAAVQADKIAREAPGAVILSFSDYARFSSVIEGHFGRGDNPSNWEGDGVIEVIPIAQGCTGVCNYCITRVARGRLRSMDPETIISQGMGAIDLGRKELQITAQDTAAYGLDIGTDLGALIESMASLEGKFRIRVGMMNPDSLRRIECEYIRVWNEPKVYKFLHLPVQSGSDPLLEKMGRRYSVGEFISQVDEFRRAHGDMTLSTDVIVGFPGETDEDHQLTKELLLRVKPDIVNITRFSPRPGTRAFHMEDKVPGRVSKERSRELTQLRFEIAGGVNLGKVGDEESVLVTERGKNRTFIGRTDSYKPVVIEGDLLLGQRVTTEIVEAAPTHLFGRLTQT